MPFLQRNQRCQSTEENTKQSGLISSFLHPSLSSCKGHCSSEPTTWLETPTATSEIAHWPQCILIQQMTPAARVHLTPFMLALWCQYLKQLTVIIHSDNYIHVQHVSQKPTLLDDGNESRASESGTTGDTGRSRNTSVNSWSRRLVRRR